MVVALSIDGEPYCVYHHVCHDEVFYVGSGTMARPFTRDGRNRRWLKFVNENPEYEIRIVAKFRDLKDARKEEASQIKSLRPKCNGKAIAEKSASTSEHISIRIPVDVMAALRREALEVERSVSWLIVKKLSASAVPALPGLSGRGVEGNALKGTGEKATKEQPDRYVSRTQPSTETGKQVSSPAAPKTSAAPSRKLDGCDQCGGLNGLHQKWCSKRLPHG